MTRIYRPRLRDFVEVQTFNVALGAFGLPAILALGHWTRPDIAVGLTVALGLQFTMIAVFLVTHTTVGQLELGLPPAPSPFEMRVVRATPAWCVACAAVISAASLLSMWVLPTVPTCLREGFPFPASPAQLVVATGILLLSFYRLGRRAGELMDLRGPTAGG